PWDSSASRTASRIWPASCARSWTGRTGGPNNLPGETVSEQSSLVTAEHFRYVAERTTREDAFLADLKRAAAAEGIPSIWIAPEQASFMQILLRLAKAREVVAVGTLAGYSAIATA